MRGMILCAGRGKRMGKLTESTPKPLLMVAGKPIVGHVIEGMLNQGIEQVVVNTAYLHEQFDLYLRTHFPDKVVISHEAEQDLETGGGIKNALALLGEAPFYVQSGDVLSDYPINFSALKPEYKAHLVLVPNPVFHPEGDFGLEGEVLVHQKQYTYGNMGYFSREFFSPKTPERFPLRDLLGPATTKRDISGELYTGPWHNIGTADELKVAREAYGARQ